MLEDLYTGNSIKVLPSILEGYSWDILQRLVSGKSGFPRFFSDGLFWVIEEEIDGCLHFKMRREIVSRKRFTDVDDYGLLGLSFINLKDTSVILTEGVSDYFTAKLLCPDRNVLGVTTLGGSKVAKKLIVNLFHSVCFCADNDVPGIVNGSNWQSFLKSYGRECTVFTPVSSFKDITENFIYNLKLNSYDFS